MTPPILDKNLNKSCTESPSEHRKRRRRMSRAQLEANLKNVEKSLANRLSDSKKEVESSSGTWKLPFFILVVMIGGVAAFFGSLYRKATKHQRLM